MKKNKEEMKKGARPGVSSAPRSGLIFPLPLRAPTTFYISAPRSSHNESSALHAPLNFCVSAPRSDLISHWRSALQYPPRTSPRKISALLEKIVYYKVKTALKYSKRLLEAKESIDIKKEAPKFLEKKF